MCGIYAREVMVNVVTRKTGVTASYIAIQITLTKVRSIVCVKDPRDSDRIEALVEI